MKNIHVLSTDKPSRLIIYSTLLNEFRLLDKPIEDWKHKRHIYITNNEVKKNGEWVLSKLNEVVKFCSLYCQNSYKKIILTTDQDLIKDGVQAIDDEFLEWFCSKNGKVDFVEMKLLDAEEKLWEEYYKKNSIYPKYPWYYKIIIPKEEAKKIFDLPIATNLGSALTETMKSVSQHEGGIKQGEINLPNFKEEVIKTEEDAKIFVETMENIPEPNDKLKKAFRDFSKQETLENHYLSTPNPLVDISRIKLDNHPDLHKQETLEEAAYLILRDYGIKSMAESINVLQVKRLMVKMANWQQEQNKNLYSEEEVFRLILARNVEFGIIEKTSVVKEWFEKFKRK